MTYAQAWRRHLLDEGTVSFLAVFGELGLFRFATVETGCVVISKSPDDDQTQYRSLWVGEKRNATPGALRALRIFSEEPFAGTDGKSWTLDETPTLRLRNSPNWRPRPGNIRREIEIVDLYVKSTVKSLFAVMQGAIPAPRDAFIIDRYEWESLQIQERRWFRRVAENDNIREGKILLGDYIFYPRSKGLPQLDGEQSLVMQLPTFATRLFQNKPKLEMRRGKRDRWWELGEDRKWLRSPSKKIVSSYFGQSGSFAYDAEGDHIVVQGYGWLPRWRMTSRSGFNMDQLCDAYLAIFNSLFFTQLLTESCPAVGGGQLNLSKRYSEGVRLPDLVTRVDTSVGIAVAVRDLSFIGQSIRSEGFSVAPRSRAEELVRLLYGTRDKIVHIA